MSENKKNIRKLFRQECLKRDNYSCVMCGVKASSYDEAEKIFDVHHIQDRSLMPNGGYVKENGITLCKDICHVKAEEFHSLGIAIPGFSVNDLYKVINSSLEKAIKESLKLYR